MQLFKTGFLCSSGCPGILSVHQVYTTTPKWMDVILKSTYTVTMEIPFVRFIMKFLSTALILSIMLLGPWWGFSSMKFGPSDFFFSFCEAVLLCSPGRPPTLNPFPPPPECCGYKYVSPHPARIILVIVCSSTCFPSYRVTDLNWF